LYIFAIIKLPGKANTSDEAVI